MISSFGGMVRVEHAPPPKLGVTPAIPGEPICINSAS